jgi:hypothetical protein
MEMGRARIESGAKAFENKRDGMGELEIGKRKGK